MISKEEKEKYHHQFTKVVKSIEFWKNIPKRKLVFGGYKKNCFEFLISIKKTLFKHSKH